MKSIEDILVSYCQMPGLMPMPESMLARLRKHVTPRIIAWGLLTLDAKVNVSRFANQILLFVKLLFRKQRLIVFILKALVGLRIWDISTNAN